MKQYLGYSSLGSSNITTFGASKESKSGAWGIASGSVHDASKDAVSTEITNHGFQSVDDMLTQDKEDGNLEDLGMLHGDEDDLLVARMEDFRLSGLPTLLEDLEEDDLFGSGGGMELETDNQENLNIGISKSGLSDGDLGNSIPNYGLSNGVGTVSGEHPYGEHPSRTLFVRNINSNVEDAELKSLFEQYGDIKTLYTACKHRGFVMISYYDIRDARTAMRQLQNKPLRRRKLDIHFSIPKDNPSDKDMNQGTLEAFNLDQSVTNDDIHKIFGACGEIKEIRETPYKKQHKVIEYYDVRAAEAALKSLDRCEIAGKIIKLELSRPGGARRSMMVQLNQEPEQDDFRNKVGSSITNATPGNWAQVNSFIEHNPFQADRKSLGFRTADNQLPGLASILHPRAVKPVKIAPIGKDRGKGNQPESIFAHPNTVVQQSHSFTESRLGQYHSTVPSFSPSNNGNHIDSLSAPEFLWGRSPSLYSDRSNSSVWTTPSMGHSFTSNGTGHGIPSSGRHGYFHGLSHHQHQVGSAPSNIPLEKRFGFLPESPEASFKSPVAFGGTDLHQNVDNFMVNLGAQGTINGGIGISGSMPEHSNFRMMNSPRPNPVFLSNVSYSGMSPTCIEGFTERVSSRRFENNGNQTDSKQHFQLDFNKIVKGEDTRTTIMLKNIPNKYTSKMLLAAIDETLAGTYDFFYLPLDFKNKCNVGYAFINMLSPKHIIPLYEAFNGKKWEKFNSEKIACLAYARIQGKTALTTHFQNSSLMNEDTRCRPILFFSEPSENNDQFIHERLPSTSLNMTVQQQNGSQLGDCPRNPKDSDLSGPRL